MGYDPVSSITFSYKALHIGSSLTNFRKFPEPEVLTAERKRKGGTFQNRPKVVDSFLGDSLCIARGFLKTVNWNLKGAQIRIIFPASADAWCRFSRRPRR